MIAIINTGERVGKGRYLYRLQINEKLIVEFTHRQADGLGECLRLAAKAADEAHRVEIEQFLKAAAEVRREYEDKEINHGVQGS